MECFDLRGLHFIYLNINILLPKIDEPRKITKLFNAAVIEINESKLDDSTLLSGIHIDNCIHFAVIETDMGER